RPRLAAMPQAGRCTTQVARSRAGLIKTWTLALKFVFVPHPTLVVFAGSITLLTSRFPARRAQHLCRWREPPVGIIKCRQARRATQPCYGGKPVCVALRGCEFFELPRVPTSSDREFFFTPRFLLV